MDLKKIQRRAWDSYKKFNKVATSVVDDEVSGVDDEDKQNVVIFTARDMAIGALVKRKEYMITGMVIGVGVTVLTIVVFNKIKKLRKTKEKEVQ